MYMPSHPNLTAFGAFTPEEIYTQSDVGEIVAYAIARAIRIIPELDSPAHSRSWWLAPEFQSLFTCTGTDFWMGTPLGQIDPTLNASYEAIGDILNDYQNYFEGQFIHLGCDEVFDECWQERSAAMTTFMTANDIEDYEGLFNYYVSRERKLLQANRTAVYWTNPATDFLTFQPGDVLQYWGNTTALVDIMEIYPDNKFILSNYDYLYLDCGMGNYFGDDSWCDPFKTWLTIYGFEPTTMLSAKQMKQVIGAETCQWGELFNYQSMDKLYPRSSALAERVWSSLDNQYADTLSVFIRLNQFHWNLDNRGIYAGPISSEYCERNPWDCFGPSSEVVGNSTVNLNRNS